VTTLITVATVSADGDVVMSSWVVTDMDLIRQVRDRLGEATAECLLNEGALAAIVKAGDDAGAVVL
jgi:hypothetical protein